MSACWGHTRPLEPLAQGWVLYPLQLSLKAVVRKPGGGETVRRVGLSDPSYARLVETVKKWVECKHPQISYTDQDGDVVSIGSQLEWQECCRQFLESKLGAVKVTVSKGKKGASKEVALEVAADHVILDDRWGAIDRYLEKELGRGYAEAILRGDPLRTAAVNVRNKSLLMISRRMLRDFVEAENAGKLAKAEAVTEVKREIRQEQPACRLQDSATLTLSALSTVQVSKATATASETQNASTATVAPETDEKSAGTQAVASSSVGTATLAPQQTSTGCLTLPNETYEKKTETTSQDVCSKGTGTLPTQTDDRDAGTTPQETCTVGTGTGVLEVVEVKSIGSGTAESKDAGVGGEADDGVEEEEEEEEEEATSPSDDYEDDFFDESASAASSTHASSYSDDFVPVDGYARPADPAPVDADADTKRPFYFF